MYINFPLLLSSGYTVNDIAYLLAIRQKEDMVTSSMPEEDIQRYINAGYVNKLKNGGLKLTQKGAAFLNVVETPRLTLEVSEILKEMVVYYESFGKDIGVSMKEAEERLSWFMGNTNFKKSLILESTKNYLESNSEYTLSLCNFIWKPPSQAFSVHMNLKNSKLFDLIVRKYGLNTDMYFKDNQNREAEWLFAVSRLPNPPAKGNLDCFFTNDYKKEKERLLDIKKILFNRLRKLNNR